MRKNLSRITVCRLEPVQHRRLKTAAFLHGTTVSGMLRILIDEFLEDYSENTPEFAKVDEMMENIGSN